MFAILTFQNIYIEHIVKIKRWNIPDYVFERQVLSKILNSRSKNPPPTLKLREGEALRFARSRRAKPSTSLKLRRAKLPYAKAAEDETLLQ